MRQAIGWSGLGFRCARAVLRGLSAGFFRLEASGLEQIPAEGGAIIAGNHPSVLDGILLLAVSPRPVRFLVA
jgi:1-acyl-sn-glycerol-3-phosphate acyltransferase